MTLLEFSKGDTIYIEDHLQSGFWSWKVLSSHKMEESGKELITALTTDDFLGFYFLRWSKHSQQESATAVEVVELAAASKHDLKEILGKQQKRTWNWSMYWLKTPN